MILLHTNCGTAGCNCTLHGGYYPNPRGSELGNTNYLGVAGIIGAVEYGPYNARRGIFTTARKKTKMRDITDGTSHTLMFGETIGDRRGAGQFVFSFAWFGAGGLPSYWGLPTNPGWYTFGAQHRGVVNFAFADGRVRGISRNINGANAGFGGTFKALTTMAYNEAINDY